MSPLLSSQDLDRLLFGHQVRQGLGQLELEKAVSLRIFGVGSIDCNQG
jgi:hypothetical protein